MLPSFPHSLSVSHLQLPCACMAHVSKRLLTVCVVCWSSRSHLGKLFSFGSFLWEGQSGQSINYINCDKFLTKHVPCSVPVHTTFSALLPVTVEGYQWGLDSFLNSSGDLELSFQEQESQLGKFPVLFCCFSLNLPNKKK